MGLVVKTVVEFEAGLLYRRRPVETVVTVTIGITKSIGASNLRANL